MQYDIHKMLESDLPYMSGNQGSSKNLEVYYFHNVPHDHGTGCSKQQWISSLSGVAYATHCHKECWPLTPFHLLLTANTGIPERICICLHNRKV